VCQDGKRRRIAELTGTARRLSVAGFAKPVAGETEKWGRVIRTASIRPEWLSAMTAGVRYASTSGLYAAILGRSRKSALPEGGAARQQPR
jgi:hypothetical protein